MKRPGYTASKKTRKGGRIGHAKSHKKPHITRAMVCNPAVENHRVRGSCYTPQILTELRREYNHQHPDHPIATTNPDEIWTELNERMSHCKKEDCWLNEIKDYAQRHKIDEATFAPDQPDKWKKNPVEWLSNFDIEKVLKQYEVAYPHFEFLGATSIDFDYPANVDGTAYKDFQSKVADAVAGKNPGLQPGVPANCIDNPVCHLSLKAQKDKGKTKIAVVFNLDRYFQPGSHWVSMFIDLDRKFLFYFDSAATPLKPEIPRLIARIEQQAKEDLGITLRVYNNGSHAHQRGGTECGMYSIYFIITLLTGKSNHQGRRHSLDSILKLFLKERIPDTLMVQYRNEYFNS
jgi:hypothetical protein